MYSRLFARGEAVRERGYYGVVVGSAELSEEMRENEVYERRDSSFLVRVENVSSPLFGDPVQTVGFALGRVGVDDRNCDPLRRHGVD